MPDFGSIQPIELTEDRKLELEQTMASANEVFADAAWVLYQSDDPADIRRLRDGYHANSKSLGRFPGAKRAFAKLQEIEAEVIGGYIRTTAKMCSSFELAGRDTRPGVEYLDYVTEAAWAIWDAMPVYNGQQRFTTFVYRCVKNRLVNFVRNEEQASGVSGGLRRLRKRVREAMKLGMSLENAVALIAGEDQLNEAAVARLRMALATFRSFGQPGDIMGDVAAKEEKREDPKVAAMRKAVENADLSPIERELIDAHLRGDRGYRSKLEREKRINPNTGRPYTRQWLSQLFHSACSKCRAAYGDPVPIPRRRRTSKPEKSAA